MERSQFPSDVSFPLTCDEYLRQVPKEQRPPILPVRRDDVYTTVSPSYNGNGNTEIIDTLGRPLDDSNIVVVEGPEKEAVRAVEEYCDKHDYGAMFRAASDMTRAGTIGSLTLDTSDGTEDVWWNDGLISKAKYAALETPTAVYFDGKLSKSVQMIMAELAEGRNEAVFPAHAMSGLDPSRCVLNSSVSNPLTVFVSVPSTEAFDKALLARCSVANLSVHD